MDELKFVPSATVWQEVEKQINERKKRRLPFLWLLLLGVLLGGATWLYTVQTTGEKIPSNQQPAVHTATEAAKTAIEKAGAPVTGNTTVPQQNGAATAANVANRELQGIQPVNAATPGKPGKNALAAKKETVAVPDAVAATARTTTSIAEKETLSVSSKAVRKPHTATGAPTIETGITKNSHRAQGHKSFIEKPAASGQQPAVSGSVSINEEDRTDNTVTDNNAHAPADAAEDTTAALMATVPVTDSSKHRDTANSPLAIAQKKPAKQKKTAVQWGISAGMGGSNISQGISGVVSNVFSASTAYSVAADRNNTQSSPGSVNNGNLNSFTRPGALKPGLSWSLNIFVSKSLGRHFQLIAGLGYSYYSMGLEVGSKIDSNKALLQFSNGNSFAYTNRFHFIELPVTLQKQLGKTSRFSVNGGLSLSLLAASNALQYSAAKNIYFKDNSNINKVQLGLLAGFNYRLLQRSLLVEAGPQLRYGLSNILEKETYGSMHLFFAGVNARIYFNRNKR